MIKIIKHECILDRPRLHIYYSAYFNGYSASGRTEWDAVSNLISESIDVRIMGNEWFLSDYRTCLRCEDCGFDFCYVYSNDLWLYCISNAFYGYPSFKWIPVLKSCTVENVYSNIVEANNWPLGVWWIMLLGCTRMDVGHFGANYLLMYHER